MCSNFQHPLNFPLCALCTTLARHASLSTLAAPAPLDPRQMFVVELSRKPLFPGIYTPVLVHNNEKLIKEVQEQRRQG